MNRFIRAKQLYSGQKSVDWFKIAFAGVIGLLLLLGTVLFFTVFSVQPVEPTSASAVTENNRIDLGDIPMKNGTKKLEFVFKNTSDKPIQLTQLYTSCMCTKAKIVTDEKETIYAGMKGHTSGLGPINPNMVLEPNRTAKVVAEFDPNAHGPQGIGPINRQVIVETNSTTTPQLMFTFTGTVTNE